MSERSGTTKWDEDLDGRDSLMATLTALRDRLREQHLHGADALDAAIERLAAIGEERRAHRTDDLIEAVSDAMEDNAYHDEKAYDLIAAVEDWQERKGEENLPLLMAMMNAESTGFLRHAEKAEAAIQRVREVPASQIVGSDGHVRDMLLRADVLRALEGDSNE